MDKLPTLQIIIETPNHSFMEALKIYQQILDRTGGEHPFVITRAHFGEELINKEVKDGQTNTRAD